MPRAFPSAWPSRIALSWAFQRSCWRLPAGPLPWLIDAGSVALSTQPSVFRNNQPFSLTPASLALERMPSVLQAERWARPLCGGGRIRRPRAPTAGQELCGPSGVRVRLSDRLAAQELHFKPQVCLSSTGCAPFRVAEPLHRLPYTETPFWMGLIGQDLTKHAPLGRPQEKEPFLPPYSQ